MTPTEQIEVILAKADGKKIECKSIEPYCDPHGDPFFRDWTQVDGLIQFNFGFYDYRVKPALLECWVNRSVTWMSGSEPCKARRTQLNNDVVHMIEATAPRLYADELLELVRSYLTRIQGCSEELSRFDAKAKELLNKISEHKS